MKLTIIALTLVLAFAAFAQAPGTFWGFNHWGDDDETLVFGQSGPEFGFFAYSAPGPPTWVSWPIQMQWQWTSSCPQGGILVQGIYINGADTLINVSSGIFNGTTGNPQGKFDGFATVNGINQPQWVTTEDHGGPCGPS